MPVGNGSKIAVMLLASLGIASLWIAGPAAAGQVVASEVAPRLTAAEENAEALCREGSQASLGRQLVNKGKDAVDKAASDLGITDGPRRKGGSCADVCATLPADARFTARGSITPQDWYGELSSGLPETVEASRATIRGPLIRPSGKTKTVCYTFINLRRDDERYVGVEFNY